MTIFDGPAGYGGPEEGPTPMNGLPQRRRGTPEPAEDEEPENRWFDPSPPPKPDPAALNEAAVRSLIQGLRAGYEARIEKEPEKATYWGGALRALSDLEAAAKHVQDAVADGGDGEEE